jgi:hypothetical protein
MATSRTPRSTESSPSTTSSVRRKRPRFSEKKRNDKKVKHRVRAAEAAYARSVAIVDRAIEALKWRLLVDSSSCRALEDFFDVVSGEEAFAFELCHGPRWLIDAIARSCEEILGIPTGESTVYLTEVPDHGLIHGSIVIGNYTGSAVYFDDIQLGAVGLYPEHCVMGERFLRLVIVDDRRRSRAAPN